jgi:hypothetical protein
MRLCGVFLTQQKGTIEVNDTKLGDYVLASAEKDGRPEAAWTCGYVVAIMYDGKTRVTVLANTPNGLPLSGWRWCRPITPQQGEDIALMVEDNLTGRSVWQMRRELVSLRITDPTPAEIAERAAQIRREWTPQEHERRSAGRYSTWEMPVCNMEALTGVGGHGVSL